MKDLRAGGDTANVFKITIAPQEIQESASAARCGQPRSSEPEGAAIADVRGRSGCVKDVVLRIVRLAVQNEVLRAEISVYGSNEVGGRLQ
jgi:hypothetical protein